MILFKSLDQLFSTRSTYHYIGLAGFLLLSPVVISLAIRIGILDQDRVTCGICTLFWAACAVMFYASRDNYVSH